jgi:signal transduction histidine kinase
MSKQIVNKAPGQSSTTRKTADTDEARLLKLTHDLLERVKELNCLYGVSRLIENRTLTLDEILKGVVELIGPAWQYPEITGVRIRLKRKNYQTANFQETSWVQAEDIIVNGKKGGTLEVCYLQERPRVYEGPFLKEERDLIHGVAEMLGKVIEYKKAEASIRTLYEREKRLSKKLKAEMDNRVYFNRQLMHELKTPLTSLMATSQLLFEETQCTKLGKVAGLVWEGANRISNRIEELHDMIRGEVGTLKLKLRQVDIASLLSSIKEETRALSEQHGLAIKIEIDKSFPPVIADPERIKQVLLNLINNAFKFALEGKLVIIKAVQESPDFLKVEVRDYGPGIPKKKQKLLFKPGYQYRHGEDMPAGLGIGLALCKMLIDLHGGEIWVVSQPGQGSSFFFTLPVSKIAAHRGQNN